MSIRSLVVTARPGGPDYRDATVHANGADKAADACIQAFVDNYLPKDRLVTVHKLSRSTRTLNVYAKRHTLDLSARVGNGGRRIATRALCGQ